MDKIVDHLFIFGNDGTIEDFPGNYSDYRTYIQSSQTASDKEVKTKKQDWKDTSSKARLSYQEQKEYRNLEKDIQRLESEKEVLEHKFATEGWGGEEIDKQSKILQRLINDIEFKTERWFELSSKLEE